MLPSMTISLCQMTVSGDDRFRQKTGAPFVFLRFEKKTYLLFPFFHSFLPISLVWEPFIAHLLFLSLLISMVYNRLPFGIISFTLSYLFLSLDLHPFHLLHFFLFRLSLVSATILIHHFLIYLLPPYSPFFFHLE